MLFHIDVISSLKIALRHKLIMKEKEMLERSYFHWELPVNKQKRNKNEKSRTTFLENTGSEMYVLFMMHFHFSLTFLSFTSLFSIICCLVNGTFLVSPGWIGSGERTT